MADTACDLFDVFVHPDIRAISLDWPDHIWVVACRHGDHATSEALTWDRVTHFVFAQPINDTTDVGHCKSHSDVEPLLAAICEKECTGQDAVLISRYLDLGFAVALTVDDGDCACDTIAICKSRIRNFLTWCSIRQITSLSMKTLASEPWFRDCFQACQEWQPPVLVDEISLEEVEDELADAGKPDLGTGALGFAESCPAGLMDAVLGSSPLPAPAPLASADVSASVPVGIAQPDETKPAIEEKPPLPPPHDSLEHSSGDDSEDSDCVPTISEKLEPSDAVVLHWALSRTPRGQEILEISDSTADMANIIALEELIQMRRE